VGLGSPQGGPCERYSLRFHNAEHLSPTGENNALRAIGAASEGTKGSIASRIQWSRDNLDLIRAIGRGDDESIRLADGADEPLQLIQLCRQWVAHENGEAWSAPIYADATNSGFQIVAGLMNSTTGLRKTNVCRKTVDDCPNDAYSECREQVVRWLLDGTEDKLNQELRNQLVLVMSDPKKGRKLSKVYGRTAIYGSSHLSQTRDLRKELDSQNITFGETKKDHDKAVGVLNSLIARAYKELVGDVMTYNRGIKSMATERFWRGMNPEFKDSVKTLCDERSELQRKDRELSDAKVTTLRNYGRELFRQCELSGTMPDGTVVDFRRFFVEKMIIRTAFHGSPISVRPIRDSLDVTEMIRATPPGIIHNLDSLILKHAYHDVPYDFTLIHDSAGCHPNHFDDLCLRYRLGFAKTMETNVIDSLAAEWGVENLVGKFSEDESWKDEIIDAIYLFN
jgi:DNA-directed RNA polymerase